MATERVLAVFDAYDDHCIREARRIAATLIGNL